MSLYDRLRDNQMPLGVGRGNVPPSEPEPRITRPENIFVPPTVAAPAPAPQPAPVFTPPQNQMVGIPTVLPAPAPAQINLPPKPVTVPPQKLPTTSIGMPIPPPPGYIYGPDGQLVQIAQIDPIKPTEPVAPPPSIQDIINTQVFPAPAPVPTPVTDDIPYVPPMPEVEQGIADLLDRITAGGGKPEDFVIYQPPAPPQDEYLRDQEERETGLEDTGVSEEVIEDVVVETPPPVGAIDSVTGEVIPEEDLILTTMPLPQPDVGLPFPSPAPAPVPAPAPATDVVTGEEIPLITPVVDVPQDSLTGLGSFFTAPEIEQIVNPPVQGSYPTDMAKLLQMQGSFLNFLSPDVTQAPVDDVVAIGEPTDGTTGYMGEGYVPGETYQPITFGNQYSYAQNYNPYSINNPYYSPVMDQVQRYNFTNMPTYVGQGYYGDLYGGLVFPDFSGITSLVPYDARQEII